MVSVIDMKSWETVKTIKTEGPGFFMRSHENSLYVWVDVFFGPNRDAMHVIDKQSLEIVRTLRPGRHDIPRPRAAPCERQRLSPGRSR